MSAFEGWAIVELLGHRVRYGRVTEVTMFGEAMLRVEIPTEPPTEEFYSGKALYGIRPASEEAIRAYHAPHKALSGHVLEGEVVVDDDEWDADGGGEHDDEPDDEAVDSAASSTLAGHPDDEDPL